MPRLALGLLLVFFAGCATTEIPPPPGDFETVVVESDLDPNQLYAEALASFMRSGWEPLTPTTEGFAVNVRPDGAEDIPVALLVVGVGEDDSVLTATADTTAAGSRNVLVRAAKILSLVSTRISYR